MGAGFWIVLSVYAGAFVFILGVKVGREIEHRHGRNGLRIR